MILRPDYINAISPFMDTPLVKILAGVRRCGKSTIFEMPVQEIKSKGVWATAQVHFYEQMRCWFSTEVEGFLTSP